MYVLALSAALLSDFGHFVSHKQHCAEPGQPPPGASISSLSSSLLSAIISLKIILSINHFAGNQAPSAFLIILKIVLFTACSRGLIRIMIHRRDSSEMTAHRFSHKTFNRFKTIVRQICYVQFVQTKIESHIKLVGEIPVVCSISTIFFTSTKHRRAPEPLPIFTILQSFIHSQQTNDCYLRLVSEFFKYLNLAFANHLKQVTRTASLAPPDPPAAAQL